MKNQKLQLSSNMSNERQDNKLAPQTEHEFMFDFLNSETNGAELLEEVPSDCEQSITNLVLEQQIVDALRNIYDPEIPINIYDLGLIYSVDIDDDKVVQVKMTLTSPGCPVAQTFPGTVECAVKCVDGVKDAHVELVWDPPWTKDRMSDDALLSLGLL